MGISGILSFPVFGMGSTPVRKTMVIWALPKQQFDIQNTISYILILCAFTNGFRNKVFETFLSEAPRVFLKRCFARIRKCSVKKCYQDTR